MEIFQESFLKPFMLPVNAKIKQTATKAFPSTKPRVISRPLEEFPRFLTTAGFTFHASIHTHDCYHTPVCHSEVHQAQANYILKLH